MTTTPMRLRDVTETMADPYSPASLERFTTDTGEHEMTIAHDDGLYRHLRFRSPARSMYWFDVITSPGLLTFNGDMGTFVFSRERDMLAFFDGSYANLHYWAEKVLAGSQIREFSVEKVKGRIATAVGEGTEGWPADAVSALRTAIDDEVDLPDSHSRSSLDLCVHALCTFAFDDGAGHTFEFYEPYEWDMEDFTVHYQWACHAIRAAVLAYRAHHTKEA